MDTSLWFPKYNPHEVIFDPTLTSAFCTHLGCSMALLCYVTRQGPKTSSLSPLANTQGTSSKSSWMQAWRGLLRFGQEQSQVWLPPKSSLLSPCFYCPLAPGLDFSLQLTVRAAVHYACCNQASLFELLPQGVLEYLVFHTAWTGSAYHDPSVFIKLVSWKDAFTIHK